MNSHAYCKIHIQDRVRDHFSKGIFIAQGEDDVEGGAVHETSGRQVSGHLPDGLVSWRFHVLGSLGVET